MCCNVMHAEMVEGGDRIMSALPSGQEAPGNARGARLGE